MSGTSLDGVDGVLAELDPDSLRPIGVRAHVHAGFPAGLASELLALNSRGDDELHRAAVATHGLMSVYAEAVRGLLHAAACAAVDVRAIGAHGQTVRHRPQAPDGSSYTLQLANGALLAERSGITTVCDFRSGDVAAGGQGAPLVPAFHATCFADPAHDVALLNVGGIANLSLLPADGPVAGFDTGPGNVLMDLWAQRAFGQAFDAGGQLAASGQVLPGLLALLRAEPYFSVPAPKSTGRDLFHAAWLDARLSAPDLSPADVMATLAELTACSAADALKAALPEVRHLYVCGGGAFNAHLMSRLRTLLPDVNVRTSDAVGVAPDQVEALAFAWLAACRLAGRTASLPSVTGACGPRVLGAVYAAPA